MSTTPADLDLLCERYGIATRYRDLWHQEHVASDATKRALLAAMNVADLLHMPAVLPAARPLIRQAGREPHDIELALQAPADAANLRWRIELESGERHEGACATHGSQDATGARVRCTDLPAHLPLGYHRLAVGDTRAGGGEVAATLLIVSPARCHAPPAGRLFGPAVQLYALRSQRNWGIGDFTDLRALVHAAAREGADFVGLNPLHALFVERPEDASPYSPSTRLALNPLYLDVEALEDFALCAPARERVTTAVFQERLAALRAEPLVDYTGVAQVKLAVLADVFDHFRVHHLENLSERGRALRAFASAHRDLAWTPALFDALHAAIQRNDPLAWGWPVWPPGYRAADGEAVEAFARTHPREVDFFLYLQWQADRQLAAAADAARDAGMALGLYRDLAVGAHPGGAETWQAPQRFALRAHVGAPPDSFNRQGQDWGLPPWIPHRLPADGYGPWINLLRANMRHAGALRIDHVMALLRLYWIPEGMTPTDGTYVRYPLDDLLAVLALESERHACAVVGEDLGTVPDEVRRALQDTGVLSYRVLWFERTGDGAFAPPPVYPSQALCCVTTHDLPTLQGFWRGSDLAARDALSLFPDDAVRDAEYAQRDADRQRLVAALAGAGLGATTGDEAATSDLARACAVHAYLARTPCALMAVQLEDVFAETEQVNLPATTDDRHPNWRRKITVALEDWAQDARFSAVCAAIRSEGRGAQARTSDSPGVATRTDARRDLP